jgi:hypothetical protein
MDLETAQRLWLVYDIPFLHLLADKPLVVVDYDLLMQDPRGQMERIARKLEIPENKNTAAEVDDFADHFLDVELRHSLFSESDIDTATDVGLLTRRAYVVLYELALDTRQPDHDFWQAWKRIETSCRTRLGWPDTE